MDMFGKKRVAFVLTVVIMFSGLYDLLQVVNANGIAQIVTENMQAERGETVTIPVSVENNPGFMGFVINVDYDSRYLEPAGVEKGAALSGTFDDNTGINVGAFEVLWSGTSDMVADDKLFELKFRVKERAPGGSTVVNLSYNQADTFNENYDNIIFECKNCIITVLGEELEGRKENAVRMEDCSKTVGQNVRIPVMISQNTGIMGFVIHVQYDVNVLRPVSVERGELIPSGSMFDDTAGANSGEFRVLWAGDENIVADGSLFYLNFEIIDSPGDTQVTLGYSAKDTFDNRYQEVALTCGVCVIHIEGESSSEKPTEQEPSERPTEEKPPEEPQSKNVVSMSFVTAYIGETVKIPVMISKNTGIYYACMKVRYDPNRLKAVSVDAGELFADESSFLEIADTGSVGELEIKLSASKNVTDDGCLLYLTFEAVGCEGDTQVNLEFVYGYDSEYEDITLTDASSTVSVWEKRTEQQKPDSSRPTGGNSNTNNSQPVVPGSKPGQDLNGKLKAPARVKVKSLKKKGAKKLQIKWKKIKGVSGYQIQYALNKKFSKGKKNKNVGRSKTSYLIKRLKSEKKYFVRIRAYKTSGGEKKYGRWSAVRSCKAL